MSIITESTQRAALQNGYQSPNGFRQATVLAVHDGDTPHVAISSGFPGLPLVFGPKAIGTNRCRMAGINSPELNTAAGIKAKDHFNALCETLHCFTDCTVEVLGLDNYGRPLIVLWGRDGNDLPISLNQKMIDDGHAVPM